MALALPEDGKLIACDVSTDFTSIGGRSTTAPAKRAQSALVGQDHDSTVKGTLRVMQQAQTVYVLPAGKPHWEAAGVADKIDLRIAPAADTLSALLKVDSVPALDIACSSLEVTLCGRFTVSEGLSGMSVLHDEPDTHVLR